MVEVSCRGANLVRNMYSFSSTQSPFAEVLVDGDSVWRSSPHEGGNKKPRWDGSCVVSPYGETLVFRVLVAGMFDDLVCGEGVVSMQQALQKETHVRTVPLQWQGSTTGFLQYTFRELEPSFKEDRGRAVVPVITKDCDAEGYGTVVVSQDSFPPPPPMVPTTSLGKASSIGSFGSSEGGFAAGRGRGLEQGTGNSEQGPGKLAITDAGREQVDALIRSKDRLRLFVQRPFQKPHMQGRTHMGYEEFRSSLCELLGELQINVPPEGLIQKMFEKHRSRNLGTNGIGLEDFECLIFRLLCFMVATGEVDVSLPPRRRSNGCTGGGGQRDKRWREEFLQKNNQRIEDVYEFGGKLGEGSFGAVFLVTHLTELSGTSRRERVCKKISKANAEKNGTPSEKIREEFAVLKRLDHPNVLRIFEDFEDDENFYIVMEPCLGGDLMEAIEQPHTRNKDAWEKWVAKALQHVLAAIAYCHEKGVIHKDLKPENVMMLSPRGAPLEDLHVVVVDFGLAQMFATMERSSEIAGTPPFMAPEVWAGNFSMACDVWSVGVIIFLMLSGQYPFMAATLEEFPAAVSKEPNWKLVRDASFEAQAICRNMLCKTEANRPSAQQLLEDEWFKSLGLCFVPEDPTEFEDLSLGLMNINERSQFEKFCGRLVATQLDAGRMKKVNECFAAFDTNHDGTLSGQELQDGLVELGESPEGAARVVQELDVGKTGSISYTEFLAGVTDFSLMRQQEQAELLWLAWKQFNPDKDSGLVKMSDIQGALAARGMTVAEMPQAIIEQLRYGTASGTMSFDDFKRLFKDSDGGLAD